MTTVKLPVTAPTTSLPVEFRQSATDADNHGVATVAAVYAQDQVTLSQQVQAVVGLRYDDFNVDFHNNRTNADLRAMMARCRRGSAWFTSRSRRCPSTAATACPSSLAPASSCRRSR